MPVTTTVESAPHSGTELNVDVERGILRNDTVETLKELETLGRWEQVKAGGKWCREYMRGPMSEFFGMFILIVFGCSSVGTTMLSKGTHGGTTTVSFCFGIGVMVAIYIASHSGAQLNPAMTFTNCLYRGFSWKKLPVYIVFQILGAFVGAALVFAFHRHAIEIYDPNLTVPGFSETATAGIFATYPQSFMTRKEMFAAEFIAGAILNFVCFALNDQKGRAMRIVQPIVMFFVVFGLGGAFGYETGCAVNLARDFGPRLFTYVVGYGSDVWKAGDGYFWIPMVAPFVGTTFGGGVYWLFFNIERTPKEEVVEEKPFDEKA